MDILIKPSTVPSAASTSSAPVSRKEPRQPMTEKEKERYEKLDVKVFFKICDIEKCSFQKKERDAARKQKFLDEKKRKRAERELEETREPKKEAPLRDNKRKERLGRPPRPSPAKTLSEQQGEDWIKKLTDPKSSIKKKHDVSD